MLQVGRNFNSPEYKYSFNGKLKDDEVKGSGNSIDFGARIYDTRTGKMLARDFLYKSYTEFSPYIFAFDNPIGFIDPDGNEVIWHSSLRNNEQFNALINNFTNTDAYKQVFKRFIENQDNVIFTKKWQGDGSFAFANPNRIPGGFVIEFASENFVNGKLAMDATFAVKILLHEGKHQKWELARTNEGTGSYPTLNRNENDPNVAEAEHETMAEGDIQLFIDGMKQYDALAGTTHSDDWYSAMAWRGSLSRATQKFQDLPKNTKDQYEKLIKNEQAYENYLKAKFKYDAKKTKGNERAMNKALDKIDKALFNQSRNRAEDENIQ